MEASSPSTVPDDLWKSLFTLCDSDILARDIVEVLKEVLATVESGGDKSSSKLTPRIKTLRQLSSFIQISSNRLSCLVMHHFLIHTEFPS
mmetsp:Transcript_19359/g.35072  ORF Transcript_19359/g.35072 Transcript_19359/m.35072 type:complete len:90 (+) Transcript_19359:273-542(+)